MRLRLWGAVLATAGAVGLSGTTVGAADAAPAPKTVVSFYTDSTTIGRLIPTFGAISGIDRTGSGQYVLVSTDVGRLGPARFYTATIPYNSVTGFAGGPAADSGSPFVGFGSSNIETGSSMLAGPAVAGGGTILGPGNLPMLPGAAQFEGIRAVGNDYVVASGGANQFVRVLGRNGSYLRDLPLPSAYRVTSKTGLNGQLGLTGVAVGPGDRISAITAGGLKQDPRTSARLITWAGRGTSEYVYRTDRDKVAADVLSVNNTDFLVLERGKGRVTRIYWTTTRGAQPVSGKKKLAGTEKVMLKRPVFSTAPLHDLNAGNMSGLAWGDWIPGSRGQKYRARTLFVVTNDVFAGPTRIHSLEVQFPKS